MTKPDNSFELDSPITQGEKTIDKLTLRKPASGELRGLSLTAILQMEVNELQKLLPRISSPTLTEQHVAEMDPADLIQAGGIIAGFFVPKAKQEQTSLTA
ncbi:phage tail assembly protein [Motiliproteus sp.]|uniref:phage tail assembly protein n=1 Tax=Motiliproteus sp. TaxID=1898955 RepID=UPI003BAB8DA5